MADVFLSYAREDLERARSLAQAIEALGWSVWWDRKIPAGRTFAEVIEEALQKARCVIVLWSRASIQSEWVREEADDAKGRRKLVPARLDDVTPPLGFRAVHAAELVGWDGSVTTPGFQQLVTDLGSMLGAPLRGEAPAPRTPSAPKQLGNRSPEAAPPHGSAERLRRAGPMVWVLAALIALGGSGGVVYKIAADRAAQAEAARVAQEARRQQASAERAAEETQRQREAADRAAEDARRQAELDTAKRAAEQERARAEQLKREMDERARVEAAKRVAEEKRLADAAAARKAAEEAERRKKELEDAQDKARARDMAQPPVTQTVPWRPTPFMGSMSLSMIDYARRHGVRQADLTSKNTMGACGSWSNGLGLSEYGGRSFRASCMSLADFANANGWDLAAQPSPQQWMTYCSSRSSAANLAGDARKEFMAVCLKYR